jgi:hypothetical protein
MGRLIPTGLRWVIDPDQSITRRKWRHYASAPEIDYGFAHVAFGPLIDMVLEHDPAEIRLRLPSGRDCVIYRVPTQDKEPE